ncbi:MAG: motility protein A [Phycisphaeraceae bacterium]|nr:motility protein A [Phycisphaeraceae bacterium]
MDLGLLFGFFGTWIIIVWALLSGGSIIAYWDVASSILVFGASVTMMFFAFPMENVKSIFAILRQLLFHKSQAPGNLITDMVYYAEIARRDGILSLENVIKDIEDTFVVHGIQMAIDGTDPELIESVLTNELENIIDRHDQGKALFDTLAKYAPAYGMIGTLVGLVIMLRNMSDPSMIGPGMAVAILTTLYGALIANSFALPMADRLARRSAEEILNKTIILKGVMAIQSGDNPRIVEKKLMTFLPPSLRKSRDDEERQAA